MYHILVCDDDRDIVSALTIYLTGEGYAVTGAGSGQEALDLFQQQTFDLVLMDIMMPGMDGITATAQLRAQSNVPILFLTAKSEDTDKILGLNMGADDYITRWRSSPGCALTCGGTLSWAASLRRLIC